MSQECIKEIGFYDTEATITIAFCSKMRNCKSDSMTITRAVEHIFEIHTEYRYKQIHTNKPRSPHTHQFLGQVDF